MARHRRRTERAGELTAKVKTAFRLTTEAVRRLGVMCAMEQIGRNDWLEAVIREKSRRWVVSDRGRPESNEFNEARPQLEECAS
jgi:hypothetical protein